MTGIFTVYQIFIIAVIGLGAGFVAYSIVDDFNKPQKVIIPVIICTILITGGAFHWYNQTASGIRAMKDYKSELSNGIDREIIITAEDSREIFYYEGKVDIEFNGDKNYIKFESEEGKRYIIHYGIQDTIIIREK